MVLVDFGLVPSGGRDQITSMWALCGGGINAADSDQFVVMLFHLFKGYCWIKYKYWSSHEALEDAGGFGEHVAVKAVQAEQYRVPWLNTAKSQ